jgi:4'-phosphopantetheinyl transferase EntD
VALGRAAQRDARAAQMIEALLPAGVVAVEALSPDPQAVLYPEEQAAIAGVDPRRRAKCATARRCARTAMRALGMSQAAILPGYLGAPIWPPALVEA